MKRIALTLLACTMMIACTPLQLKQAQPIVSVGSTLIGDGLCLALPPSEQTIARTVAQAVSTMTPAQAAQYLANPSPAIKASAFYVQLYSLLKPIADQQTCTTDAKGVQTCAASTPAAWLDTFGTVGQQMASGCATALGVATS